MHFRAGLASLWPPIRIYLIADRWSAVSFVLTKELGVGVRGAGVEPAQGLRPSDLKSDAFDRSATPASAEQRELEGEEIKPITP